MSRKWIRWPIVLAVLLLVSQSAFATLVLSKPWPSPPEASQKPCPKHDDNFRCWSAAYTLQVLKAGTNEIFEDALGEGLAGRWDPTDWTFAPGDPLNLTLTVAAYGAYNDCPDYLGAFLVLNRPADPSLEWVQVVRTNRSNWVGLNTYLDTRAEPGDQPAPVYPLKYADGHFEDQPGRYCEQWQHIEWEGFLYLCNVDSGAKTITYREGVWWGFSVDCMPEPSTLVLFAGGAGWMGIGIFRRRRM